MTPTAIHESTGGQVAERSARTTSKGGHVNATAPGKPGQATMSGRAARSADLDAAHNERRQASRCGGIAYGPRALASTGGHSETATWG